MAELMHTRNEEWWFKTRTTKAISAHARLLLTCISLNSKIQSQQCTCITCFKSMHTSMTQISTTCVVHSQFAIFEYMQQRQVWCVVSARPHASTVGDMSSHWRPTTNRIRTRIRQVEFNKYQWFRYVGCLKFLLLFTVTSVTTYIYWYCHISEFH